MNGLSDSAQAALVVIAYVFGAIGLMTEAIPSQIPEPLKSYIALAFLLMGAIALGVKEALGIIPQPTQTSQTAQTAKPPTSQTPLPVLDSKRRLMFLAFRT